MKPTSEFHPMFAAESGEDLAVRGTRLFAFGHDLDRHGHSLGADQLYQQAISLLENGFAVGQGQLSATRFAEIALSHAKVLFSLRRFAESSAACRRAVELLEESRSDGVSAPAIELLAKAYSWLGHAENLDRRASESVEAFRKARGLWKALLRFAPKQRSEYCCRAIISSCFGSSKALDQLGQFELADHYRDLAFELRRLLKRR